MKKLGSQAHKVKTLEFQIVSDNVQEAPGLLDRLEAKIKHQLIQVIEGVFDEFEDYGSLIIDELEIDLGEVSYYEVDSELEQKLRDELRERIQDFIAKSAQQKIYASETYTSTEKQQSESIYAVRIENWEEIYLETGILPWWIDKEQAEDPKAIILKWIKERQERFLQSVKQSYALPQYRKRLSQHVSSSELKSSIGIDLEQLWRTYSYIYQLLYTANIVQRISKEALWKIVSGQLFKALNQKNAINRIGVYVPVLTTVLKYVSYQTRATEEELLVLATVRIKDYAVALQALKVLNENYSLPSSTGLDVRLWKNVSKKEMITFFFQLPSTESKTSYFQKLFPEYSLKFIELEGLIRKLGSVFSLTRHEEDLRIDSLIEAFVESYVLDEVSVSESHLLKEMSSKVVQGMFKASSLSAQEIKRKAVEIWKDREVVSVFVPMVQSGSIPDRELKVLLSQLISDKDQIPFELKTEIEKRFTDVSDIWETSSDEKDKVPEEDTKEEKKSSVTGIRSPLMDYLLFGIIPRGEEESTWLIEQFNRLESFPIDPVYIQRLFSSFTWSELHDVYYRLYKSAIDRQVWIPTLKLWLAKTKLPIDEILEPALTGEYSESVMSNVELMIFITEHAINFQKVAFYPEAIWEEFITKLLTDYKSILHEVTESLTTVRKYKLYQFILREKLLSREELEEEWPEASSFSHLLSGIEEGTLRIDKEDFSKLPEIDEKNSLPEKIDDRVETRKESESKEDLDEDEELTDHRGKLLDVEEDVDADNIELEESERKLLEKSLDKHHEEDIEKESIQKEKKRKSIDDDDESVEAQDEKDLEEILEDLEEEVIQVSDEIEKKIEEILESSVFFNGAGIVLLSPYLARLFGRLELLDDEKNLSDTSAKMKAVELMHYLVFGVDEMVEHHTILYKILASLPISIPVPEKISLSSSEKELCDGMLSAVIKNWPALKNTSIDNFRASFLVREGKLTLKPIQYVVRVEEKGYDILLDRIPWSFKILKFKWMELPVQVEWR